MGMKLWKVDYIFMTVPYTSYILAFSKNNAKEILEDAYKKQYPSAFRSPKLDFLSIREMPMALETIIHTEAIENI